MDSRRIAFALVAALILASGATFFLYSKMRKSQANQPTKIKVVVAKQDLAAGSPLGADSLAVLEWPADIKLEGSHGKPEDVLGRALIYPVSQNQPILDSNIALAGSGIGLTVKIPEGMRAVSMRSNDVVGVAGFLYPGSHVDLVLTIRPEGSNTMQTQTILQNVEVLTAGQRIEPDPKGKPETVNVVTLLLNPEDSEKLVLASQQGTVQFVLRNGADQTKVVTKAVRMDELITGRPAAGDATLSGKRSLRRAVKATPPPNFYEVETISAGKRGVDKFVEPSKPNE